MPETINSIEPDLSSAFDPNNNKLLLSKKSNKYVNNINPHLDELETDNLYHINIRRTNTNLKEQFGDVKVKFK
jgi:hypothetical protein